MTKTKKSLYGCSKNHYISGGEELYKQVATLYYNETSIADTVCNFARYKF